MVIIKKNTMKPTCERNISGSRLTGLIGDDGDFYVQERENFPRFNLYEEPAAWVFTFEVPGVEPGDLDVSVHNSVMTVNGHRSTYQGGEGCMVHRSESCIGDCAFSRSLRLPDDADVESIRARLHQGMLTVTLKKRDALQQGKVLVRIEEDQESGETCG